MKLSGGRVSELEAVRAELSVLRGLVEQLLAKTGAERQRLFEFKDAARLLGVHPMTISKMVRLGEVLPVSVRGKRMIPISEIDRLSAPPQMKSSGATPERVRYDAAEASRRLAELRKRR